MTSNLVKRRINSQLITEVTFELTAPALDFIGDSLCSWLEEYIDGGAMILDGHTIQYGFTFLKCRVVDGRLTLLAPDFRSLPTQWQNDLAATFGILAEHKYVPESFGFAPDIPSCRDIAMVGARFDEMPMFANRMLPCKSKPNDSGWFFGNRSDDVDNNDPKQLRWISLYEAVLALPQLVSFLSLPVGCQVYFSGDRPTIAQDYEPLPIPVDSYVDHLLNHAA